MNAQLLLSFIVANFNTITGNTVENTGECVGLISVWMDTLGIAHEWGDAKDLLDNADTSKFDVIRNIPNDLTQHPNPGDIAVWDSSWGGGFGHTGVVVAADGSWLDVYEQNNPGNPHIVHHINYSGVLGWLHPQNQTVTPPQTPALTDDEQRSLQVLTESFPNLKDLGGNPFGNLEGLTRELVDKYPRYSEMAGQVSILKGQLSEMTKQRDDAIAKLSTSPVEGSKTADSPTLTQLVSLLFKRLFG